MLQYILRHHFHKTNIRTTLSEVATNIESLGDAQQSSVDHQGHASRAIDANRDTYYGGESCTHTEGEANP